MKEFSSFLGIDLGSSGVRISIINESKLLEYFDQMEYESGLRNPIDWKNCCENLITKVPISLKKNIKACSIDGTSGTLLACSNEGEAYGEALEFKLIFPQYINTITSLVPEEADAIYSYSSLSRAIHLIKKYGENIYLRHQADWISGWLLNNWTWGEEGNNLRLGWNLRRKEWPNIYLHNKWKYSLPKIIESGKIFGKICHSKANQLGLPEDTLIVAGTTDSNAAVIASGAKKDEGITVLGSTIVVKSFVNSPLKGLGVSNHKVSGHWIAGGASNAGGKIFQKFFSKREIIELSKQINPRKESGYKMLPLTEKGERFPINDPELEPILEPRPVSDSLFLQALMEGLATIETQGWQKLIKLGARKPKRIITIGGGAKNQQWKRIREQKIQIPIKTSNKPPSYGSAIIAMEAISINKLTN